MSEGASEFPIGEPGKVEAPKLVDVLGLEASVEAAVKRAKESNSDGRRDTSPTERIVIHHYPEGEDNEEGKLISHIALTQRMPNGSYDTVMNYSIMRDGDETTTRILKQPPVRRPSYEELYQGEDPESVSGEDAARSALDKIRDDVEQAIQMGLHDITADEVHDLQS